MNSRTEAIWLFSEMNSNAEALTARVGEPRDAPMPACITGHSSIRPSSVAHAGMSRIIITSSESRARHGDLPMPRHLDAKCVESGLRLAVVIPQACQHPDQLLRRVHADVLVEDGPPDLEHADNVVTDREVVG